MLKYRPATVILISQVNINSIDARRPCRNQRAFQKTVWVTLQVVPILECARLALVDVNRHQARSRLGRYQLPFTACRKASSAKAAQSGIFHERNNIRRLPLARDTSCGESISARRAIVGVRNVARSDGRVCARVSDTPGFHGILYPLDR